MTTCTHRCGCLLAHEPAQALADLLKAAVEVDEIIDDLDDIDSLNSDERRCLNALRLAVRRLA